MNTEMDSAELQVVYEATSVNATVPDTTINVMVGEGAKIEVGEAITYIKSGQAEIGEAVASGKIVLDNHTSAKIGEFNTNATEKTNAFNSNATDKTTAFNNNASGKTTDFNENYTEKKALIDADVQLAKDWATKTDGTVDGEDYSAKYYAQSIIPISEDITTVASISSDVTTVAGISTDVSTISGISADVTSVAGNSTDISTVASDIANINAVAGDLTNIDAVADNETNINAVNANKTNIDAVAGNATNINAVAGNETNINAVNANKTNIDTVAGNNANITAVANNETNINAVNANKTNIDTVAGINSDVSTVAGISTDVSTVSSINSDVTSVATNNTNISTVAGSIANVNTVAGDISNINNVAGDLTNIDAVNANRTNINRVANIRTNVTKVANIDTNVTTVAGIASNVTTVAGISTDVTTVATNISDVSTVVTNMADINAVADDLTNINTVSSNITDVNTVAGISSDVSAVASNATDISTVAGVSSDVSAVAGDLTNIDAVKNNATNINAVAGDLTNINAVANDLTNIDNASSYANLAKDWAIKINGKVDGSEYSAKYYAEYTASLLSTKADKATTLAGYGITDAYTKTEVDTALSGKQNSLDTTQMAAVNSGANTTNIGQIATNTSDIGTINGKIPSTASTSNQLADKNYVDTADNNLQSQIDAIVASSDVFDIVGTYAELQAYDISTVPVNDIIKVLVDSTHDNAATYYRCVESGGVKSWSYIGAEGAYYTKSETDTLLQAKQNEITSSNMLSADLVDDSSTTNKFVTSTDINTWNAKQNALTAGTGINITSDTISNSGVRSVSTGATNGTISVNTNGTSAEVAVYGLGSAAYTASTDYDVSGAASTAETNAKNYADGLASNYATAAQGALADTAVQPGDLATVATSGSYNDLSNKPTIPTVNNATLTIQKNGTTVKTFMANASSNVTANITVPTTAADVGAVASNSAITGATKCKITYDSKGLVTGGADLQASDIPDLSSTYLTEVTSGDVTTALGYTPLSSNDIDQTYDGTSTNAQSGVAVAEAISTKQDTLVSGTNIKTINNNSLLGSGDLTIDSLPSQSGQSGKYLTTDGTSASWGSISGVTVDQTYDGTSTNAQSGTAVAGAISTKANDSDVVKISGAQDIGGEKTFTDNAIISKEAPILCEKNTGITRNTVPVSDLFLVTLCGQDSVGKRTWGIYHRYYTTKETNVNLICYKGTTTDNTWTGIGVGYDSSGNQYTYAPTPATSDNSTNIATTAYVKAQEYITTTTRTVENKEVKFALSNGFKVATKEIAPSASGDTSWSYGITFSHTPTIIAMRRTGASTTTGSYQAWVRGDVGKSSCKVYSTGSATWMLVAIGD